jgi:hypothetical protein
MYSGVLLQKNISQNATQKPDLVSVIFQKTGLNHIHTKRKPIRLKYVNLRAFSLDKM